MSTRNSRATTPRGNTRSSRKRKTFLDVDLNVPPSENLDQEGTSTRTNMGNMAPGLAGGSVPPATIDVEALEDDVIISSPRAFAEAKINSRRTRSNPVVVDVDSEESTTRIVPYKRRKPSTAIANNQPLVINLESTSNSVLQKKKQTVKVTPPPPPPPPPPKEPVFSCPVCMGSLVEETSTKCGHIFCKKCIKAAVSAQSKCPTCRRKMTMKDTIRIYLPSTA